jgi:hypothetical protein
MAELDTNIPLGIKVPEYDPMGDAYKFAQMRNAQQTFQSNNLALEENRRKLQEQTGLRNMLASGVDPLSAEGQRQAFMIAPNLGPTFVKTALEAQKAQRDAEAARTDLAVKNLGYARSLMPGISDQGQLDKFLGYVNQNLPNVATNIPTKFDEFAAKRDDLMKTADQSLQRHFYETEQAGPNGPIKTMQSTNMYGAPQGTATVGAVQSPVKMDINTDATGAVSAINPYNATAKPVMVNPMGTAPLSQSYDPVAYDAAMRKAEGTGKNLNSSAQGDYQFTDGTFVNMFKKTFPEAKGMSDSQILAMRGSTLPNGQKVESVLGPAFTAQNVQYLQSKGLPVTGATAYLAHFLGAQGAERLLKADPNTPVSQVVSPDAIAANKSILQGKTVGDVQQWAANLIDKKGGTIGTASGALPAFSQSGAGPSFAQPSAVGGPVTGGGAVTSGGYVPPQIGVNALAPQQQAAQNALAQQNQPVTTQITPYQMPINRAPAQPVAPVENAPQQLGAGTKTQATYEEELARKRAADVAKKEDQIPQMESVISELENISKPGGLISKSTSSTVGQGLDWAARQFGVATSGDVAIARLKPISDMVLKMVPRFEGPQSDKDTASYKAASGDLANPDLPVQTRQAAAKEIARLMRTRRDQFVANNAGGAGGPSASSPSGGNMIDFRSLK